MPRKSIIAANELVGVVETATAKLRLISESDATLKPAPGKWSKKEIVGHLLDSAANNTQRFVRAQITEEFSFPGYDQDEWVRRQDYNSKPWLELVDLWRLYNRHVAHTVRNIPDDRLETLCRIGAGEPVTLSALVEDYVAHLKHHLEQLGVTNV